MDPQLEPADTDQRGEGQVRHTKIIATLGPASDGADILTALIAAGADLFRLNFSHGTHAEHAARFAGLGEAAARSGARIAVLQDLSGPKIRTGRLEGGRPVQLQAGDTLVIEIGDGVGRPGHVFTTFAPLASALAPGHHLLLDDGYIELRVSNVSGSRITTTVLDGGPLGERKGINAPGVALPVAGLTDKDERDLQFGLALGVDLVAISFVQRASDVEAARAIARREGRPAVPLIAKLERPEAIERLDEILAVADGVMVARGDLGLEIPLQRVPRVQLEIMRRARGRGVPTILATQVLESMRREPRPTRAEVSDAATAVMQRADAIMLSGETAVGAYPVRAVEVLDTIIREVEQDDDAAAESAGTPDHVAALCDAAITLARQSQARAIIAVTREGRTARLLSMRRPFAPVYAASDREEVARRVAQWWGVRALVTDIDGDLDAVASRAMEQLVQRAQLEAGATAVIVNASPDLDRGAANFLRVRRA
jgi:pyruvate kinase